MTALTSEEKHIALSWFYQGNTNPVMYRQARLWIVGRLDMKINRAFV